MSQGRLNEVSGRLASLEQLDGIMGALGAIAAARAQACRALLPGIGAFADTVAQAIGQALRLGGRIERRDTAATAVPGGHGLIVLTNEHGFAGNLAARVVEAALGAVPHAAPLLVVGERGVRAALARGYRPHACLPMASQPQAVDDLARELAERLEALLVAGALARLDVVHAEPHGAEWRIAQRTLLPLPLDDWPAHAPARTPPLVHLPPARLVEALAEDYVFARLAEAAMNGLAAECMARVATMRRARDNIARTSEALRTTERTLRQEGITAEILELDHGELAGQ